MTDTERLNFMEEQFALFDYSIGQEEFSKRWTIWSEEVKDPPVLGRTLREAIDRLHADVEDEPTAPAKGDEDE